MEEERCGFNPANSIQIDPNETLRIPTEFQHRQPTLKLNQKSRHREQEYSPFINRSNQNIGLTSSSFMPPDSPLIHINGRLSLKSPSINSKNYNTRILNSPYPENQSTNMLNRSKAPRPVYRRPS